MKHLSTHITHVTVYLHKTNESKERVAQLLRGYLPSSMTFSLLTSKASFITGPI